MQHNGENEVAKCEDEERGLEDLENGATKEEIHFVFARGAFEEIVLIDPVLYAESDDETRSGKRNKIGIERAGIDLKDVIRVTIDNIELSLLDFSVQIKLEHVDLCLIAVLDELRDCNDDG